MARAAQAQATNAANTAGSMGGSLQSEGQAIQSSLTPKLLAETTASHSMDPTQLNELLTAAGAGTGGATAGLEGRAELESSASRNTGNLTAMQDSLAQGRQKSLASANEGIAAQDVQGALANKQTALGELGQMGQADTSDALKAMGLQGQDINTEIEAGKSGWFQNLTGMISALKPGASVGGFSIGGGGK